MKANDSAFVSFSVCKHLPFFSILLSFFVLFYSWIHFCFLTSSFMFRWAIVADGACISIERCWYSCLLDDHTEASRRRWSDIQSGAKNAGSRSSGNLNLLMLYAYLNAAALFPVELSPPPPPTTPPPSPLLSLLTPLSLNLSPFHSLKNNFSFHCLLIASWWNLQIMCNSMYGKRNIQKNSYSKLSNIVTLVIDLSWRQHMYIESSHLGCFAWKHSTYCEWHFTSNSLLCRCWKYSIQVVWFNMKGILLWNFISQFYSGWGGFYWL